MFSAVPGHEHRRRRRRGCHFQVFLLFCNLVLNCSRSGFNQCCRSHYKDLSLLYGVNCTCRKPTGAAGKGLYELKPELFVEYNPCFYHYSKTEQAKVEISSLSFTKLPSFSYIRVGFFFLLVNNVLLCIYIVGVCCCMCCVQVRLCLCILMAFFKDWNLLTDWLPGHSCMKSASKLKILYCRHIVLYRHSHLPKL